ncbi:MAG: nuclear transport factor 2 family protein [Solirubrobacterales bacterium]|nr:nuclear transport factor 2 family protein [Solirubrobacterales bacterium]
MSPQEHVGVVQALYEAFGRGDVAAIQERLADDVDWAVEAESTTAPWFGPRSGKDGAASFFAELGQNIEVSDFRPHSFATGENDVHCLVDWTFRSRSTDREATMTMHHYWRFRDGKIAYFRGSEDTEQTAKLFG